MEEELQSQEDFFAEVFLC